MAFRATSRKGTATTASAKQVIMITFAFGPEVSCRYSGDIVLGFGPIMYESVGKQFDNETRERKQCRTAVDWLVCTRRMRRVLIDKYISI